MRIQQSIEHHSHMSITVNQKQSKLMELNMVMSLYLQDLAELTLK